MQSFLEKTAGFILEKYGDRIGDLCLVLPNRRAGLFFKRYLAPMAGKTTWSPAIYSIEDFIQELCGMQKIDNIALLFEVYAIYREEKGNEAEPFDEFARWAQVFIQDINEIDRYRVDAGQLFGNLQNIRQIENWSLSGEQLTEFQKQYLEFYRSLGGLYEKLKAKLLARRQVYEGLAFRLVSEQVDEKLKKHCWHKIIFAGFNALNAAEEHLFRTLHARGMADLLWDCDRYYLDDTAQEAGKFLRRLIPSFKKEKNEEPLWQEDILGSSPKKITVIGTAKNVGQAVAAGKLLRELKLKPEELNRTALVLADENLLFPVLHTLPEETGSVNVTMGYPLKQTPFAGLADILFNLHVHARPAGATPRFYHRELLRLLAHPYIKFLFPGVAGALKQAVIKRNYVFVSAAELKTFTEEKTEAFEKFTALLQPWQIPADALLCMEKLIGMLKERFMNDKERASVETEYLLGFSKLFKRLRTLLDEYGAALELKTLQSLVKQLVASSSLPFYGEPLSGLQVMGVLETRTLDFDHVIMLSVNENVIPAAKTQHSFIPYDLKKAFGLPTYSDKDAVFAYHFYRLLQRASNVYLLYNTETDEFGKGEKSRFITQLLYELPRANPSLTIEEKLAVSDHAIVNHSPVSVPKTKEVMQKLEEKAVKGFSPSALNTYKKCALQFYFSHIAGLRETDEVEETIGADTLGSAIHKVLEELYRPHLGKAIRVEDVQAMKARVEELTQNAFRELYSSHELTHGKNLLTLRIAVKYVNNFLDAECSFLEKLEKENKTLTILELERPLDYVLDTGSRQVLLHGNADRIDRISGLTRIIDYKTGKTENKELKIEDWSGVISDPLLNKSLQLMMYALMYAEGIDAVPAEGSAQGRSRKNTMQTPAGKSLQSGIITFRELSAGLKTVKAGGKDLLDEEVLARFKEQLAILLEELFDAGKPFTQTEDQRICSFCAFSAVCNRA